MYIRYISESATVILLKPSVFFTYHQVYIQKFYMLLPLL